MYEIARGPLVWIAVLIAIAGLSYRIVSLVRMSARRRVFRTDEESPRAGRFRMPGGTLFKTHPLMAVTTTVFHVCLIVTPLFVVGHGVLFLESWSVSPPTMSEPATDGLTMLFLISAILLLARRLAVPKVRAITTVYDYVLMLVVIAPFATGFLAYRQVGDYEKIITAHIISGEALLVSLGVTKLGHMILFFFARFFVGSEYSYSAGTRRWLTR